MRSWTLPFGGAIDIICCQIGIVCVIIIIQLYLYSMCDGIIQLLFSHQRCCGPLSHLLLCFCCDGMRVICGISGLHYKIFLLGPTRISRPKSPLVTSFETSEFNFQLLCFIHDMCVVSVFHFCHLCLPVWITCELRSMMCFQNKNVLRVLLKRVSEICKLCFTIWKWFKVLTTEVTIC